MSVETLPGSQWPELTPLDREIEPPPFPTDALPTWLAHFVRAQATASQVPEDLAGMLALAAVSAAMQGRVNVIANNNTWEEPITLYTAIAMPPGERKSSIFDRVTRPLSDWELEVQEIEYPVVSAAQQELKELEKNVEAADHKVGKLGAAFRDLQRSDMAAPDTVRAAEADLITARDEAVDARVRLMQHKPRHKMRLIYNDLTPEACAQNLSQQRHERLAIMSDEGGVFEVLTGSRYADRLNLDVFLKGHSGNRIQVDRVGRDSETIMRPMLTLGLAVQPSVLHDIGKSKQMHGRGLLARFAYSLPRSLIGRRVIDAPDVSEAIRSAYHQSMREIAQQAYGQQEIRKIFLSEEADSVFMGFQQALEPRLDRDEGDLAIIGEWAGKLVGLILRISVLIAAARERGIPEEVAYEDMIAAIEFADYLEAHARIAFGLMGITPNVGLEGKIIARIQRDGLTEFKTRDIQRAIHAARAYSTDDLEEVLEGLTKMGYLRRITTSLKPPRWHWAVNPAIHEETEA